jgi:hypothetical protein
MISKRCLREKGKTAVPKLCRLVFFAQGAFRPPRRSYSAAIMSSSSRSLCFDGFGDLLLTPLG